MALPCTEIEVDNETFHIITLPDRRPTSGSSQPTKWLYQMCVESFLYHHDDAASRTTGAFYRLLQRTPGAAGRALCLRNASIATGLITDAEWGVLREPFQACVRVLTLIPVDIAVKAIAVFGETDRSAALIQALGYDRPSEWDEDEAGEEEGGESEGRAEEEEDDDGNDSGEHSGDRSDGEASIAATEQFEYGEEDGEGAGGGGGGGGGDGQQQDRAKKSRVATYTLLDVPPALQRELDSFTEWRLKPINRNRDGVSVEPATAAGNKSDALRLLGWLKSEKNIAPSLGGVFGSEGLGQAVQAFMDHLRACGRLYSTCAGYINSFVAVARFVHAARVARAPHQATAVSAAPVDAMRRAHRQIMQQARLEQKFAAKPKAWLDWPAVLTARARAVRTYELRKEEEGGPGARARLFDAALLTWLTVVPPDRVGVARQLQLGVTLKPTAGGGFELDLRTPDAHKTAAIFGPSTTAVPGAACALLRAWLAAAGLATTAAAAKPYVFVLGGGRGGGAAVDHSEPLGTPRWTETVKAVLKRQAGVPLAPKDLRSSFITFLLSDANSDEALKKAVAHAMRHSPAQQGSAAYDKEGAERTWAAAVRVAGAFAARFA